MARSQARRSDAARVRRRSTGRNDLEAGHSKPAFTKVHGHRTRNGDKLESPTYTTWRAMMQRCHNKNHPSYERYGAEGVIVVPRWHNFANFLADMGERPAGKTLGRLTPFNNYGPGECAWQTIAQQTASIRYPTHRAHVVEAVGPDGRKRRMSKYRWAKYLGIKYRTLLGRIAHGWGADAYRVRAGQRRDAS
jgi:hypothetical protein